MGIITHIYCDHCHQQILASGISTTGHYVFFTIDKLSTRNSITLGGNERFFCNLDHHQLYWQALLSGLPDVPRSLMK